MEPIHVNHSIPDAVAFAIDSPAGTIIQTGDFQIDYTPLACGVTDLSTLAEYGQDVYKRQQSGFCPPAEASGPVFRPAGLR